MQTLIIETSTQKGCVALAKNGEVVDQMQLPLGLRHSNFLLPAIQELLKKNNWSLSQLEQVVVGVGPGSYTGIRVGVVTARTIAFSLSIPLRSVSTLEGFVPSQEGPFAAIIDAKISGVYLLEGIKEKEISFIGEPQVISMDQLEEKLTNISTIVTPDKNALLKKFSFSANVEEKEPDPVMLLRGAKEQDTILYLRKTQAELEREQAG